MPFRESGVSSREKLKVSQEQQAILETPTKQPKTQEEISVEIKESALRTERSLLSDQELLSSAGERASAELKQKAKKYMANVLLIHTDRLISQTPNNLIENYNANRLSLEAINGLALTLVQTNPESMTILGVSGELEELKCTEDNAGEFLRAVQLLDEVVGGNSAELQKELLRIQNTQEQHNNGIESLQSRFKKLFVGNSQRLEALGKPEIQELFNDFESEINGQNAEIEHDRARADQLILEIRKLEDRVKAGEVSDAELKEKQTEFASLKTDYSQAVLDKALHIC
ncbi:MAG: hypothetical protein NT091_01280, partial [Candidatus Falkowbacteria bacterium]|nr:hypothetical protein [Candidatus Falkowbacteria bacterium]